MEKLTAPDVSSLQRLSLREWKNILGWPVLGLIILVLLWVSVHHSNSNAKADAEKSIRNHAAVTANSYAQQLGHTVEQIDQIALRLKYAWEDPYSTVNLEKEREFGLFPESNLLYANLFDAAGNLITSSLRDRYPTNVAKEPYFQAHRENCCLGLLISETSPSLLLKRPIVRFTRRLERADGTFEGVVFISVEPPYLVSFQGSAARGPNDFLTVRLATGPVLATSVGKKQNNAPIFHREDPAFPGNHGVAFERGERFHDGRDRFVAWEKLEKYPLVAIAGFTVDDAYASYNAHIKSTDAIATISSIVIILVSIAATYAAFRFVRRQREIEGTQDTYRLATDAANEGFYMIRPIYNRNNYPEDFRLEDCNNRAAELIGSTRAALLGMKASELRPDSFRDEMTSLCRLALEKGFLEEEARISSHSPLKATWVYRRIVRSRAGLALTLRDISESKEQEQKLANLANNDTLTNLPNRNWLSSYLPEAVRQAKNGIHHLAVLFIDLDNFKNVNDTLGHDAGDELLVQAAHRLKTAVRTSDHVVRLGGDEFLVILDQIDVVEGASKVAKAIVKAINKPYALASGIGRDISASIGISLYPDDGTDAETLLKHADIAMYAAKAAGKGRYSFYHSHLSDSLVLRLSKERALREAVENDEFIVHYQPRVDITSSRMTSMEALVRWERPDHGLIYPSDFIDLAEDMRLIVKIGELVIKKVCAQIAQWKMQGLLLVPVSVNISSYQLKCGTLSAYIASCVEHYGIEPQYLEAELTESAVIDNSAPVLRELAALRALGIKLMIDDFGTGYSSMAQLHRLDVDVLKVDQAFTQALSGGSEGKLLFGAITSMANALNIGVVAEGVETLEQLEALQHLSCDEIQGYVISKAVAAEEMANLLLKRFLLPRTYQHTE